MAIYEGARPRPVTLPRRRPRSRPVRAGRRTSPGSIVLGGILAVFVLGLMYLGQSIHVAATSREIDRLVDQRDRLQQDIQSLQGTLARWAGEPAIVQTAQQHGLASLGGKIRIPAR